MDWNNNNNSVYNNNNYTWDENNNNYECWCRYSRNSSDVATFYENGSVLITGGTGFIGKALTEKLLRTCPKLKHVYLLIRPKRNLDAKQRYEILMQNKVFDRIRDCVDLLKKVVLIDGDVTKPLMGLSQEDQEILLSNVTVVFHSAATVKFNESLDTALNLNTMGTRRVIKFCAKMDKLKAFIHVSTAYSNVDKAEVMEHVYSICDENMNNEGLIESELHSIAEKLLPTHPNTYTLTKCMAEWCVSQIADDLPAAVAIVRPSIVTAAWKEPFPGWVDNVSGITGIMMEIGRGSIRSIICDQRLVVDIVPVDIVVNTLLTAAWHATISRGNEATRVYNCTSGTINPLRWEELGALTQKHSLCSPSMYVQWYPGFTFRTNRFIHSIVDNMFHLLPAFVIDTMLRLSASKPIMLRIYKRFKSAAKTGEFFALHQWNFSNKNLRTLEQSLINGSPRDDQLFTVTVQNVDWDMYIRDYIHGIRKFVMNDPLSTIPDARIKLNRLYYAHRFVQAMTVYAIFKLVKY